MDVICFRDHDSSVKGKLVRQLRALVSHAVQYSVAEQILTASCKRDGSPHGPVTYTLGGQVLGTVDET